MKKRPGHAARNGILPADSVRREIAHQRELSRDLSRRQWHAGPDLGLWDVDERLARASRETNPDATREFVDFSDRR